MVCLLGVCPHCTLWQVLNSVDIVATRTCASLLQLQRMFCISLVCVAGWCGKAVLCMVWLAGLRAGCP